MKRLWILLLLVVFFPCRATHAQATVLAPGVEAAITALHLDQAANFIKNMEQFATTAVSTTVMMENLIKQVEMAANNLSRIGEIHSFNDLMDWYNRQLYLERQSIETFENMSISIGKKNYKLTDIEGIAYGIKDTYIDYWDKEFTEEQKQEMWTGLGMTPANYAYVQTWKAKEKEILTKFLTSPTVQNKEYMQNMIRNNKILTRLVDDAKKPEDEKMGEKEIAAMNAEMAVHNNKVLGDIDGKLADIQEYLAVEKNLENTPDDAAPIYEWPENGFRPLKK